MAHISFSNLEIILVLEETTGVSGLFLLSELEGVTTGIEKVEDRYVAKYPTACRTNPLQTNVPLCQEGHFYTPFSELKRQRKGSFPMITNMTQKSKSPAHRISIHIECSIP